MTTDIREVEAAWAEQGQNNYSDETDHGKGSRDSIQKLEVSVHPSTLRPRRPGGMSRGRHHDYRSTLPMNDRVRSSFGDSNIAPGVPSSWTMPRTLKGPGGAT